MAHNELALLKDSFMVEKGTVEGDRERGALVPPLLSHGGHRHDISGLKELAFWTCPLPSLPHYTLIPLPVRTPSLLFSPMPVWMQRLAGHVEATAAVCV